MMIRQFQRMLPAIKEAIELEVHKALAASAEMIAERAKAKIGNKQSDWPELADSTIREKDKKGYATPDPLLETGKLRDSIKTEVEGHRAVIGSDDPVAIYQEGGTYTDPPRPFLIPSVIELKDEIEAEFAKAIAEAFMLKK